MTRSGVLELPGGVRARIHLGSEQTGGAFAFLTDTAPPGWSLPPHRHEHEAETIHITSGGLWLDVEGERREIGPGETAFVDRGRVHSGGTLGEQPVERVIVFSPAGIEGFFRALAQTREPEEMLRLADEYGWRF